MNCCENNGSVVNGSDFSNIGGDESEKACGCREAQKTVRPDEEKKKLINRLARLEGQIRGIKAMVENDAYCVDILTQAAAAKAAFSSFSRELLSRHMHTCVVRDIQNGDEEVVDELMEILTKLMR